MNFSKIITNISDFFTMDRTIHFLIIYISTTLAFYSGMIYGILLFLSITYTYYYVRNKMLSISLEAIQYNFVCDHSVKKYFVHEDLPALIEQTIKELSQKYNYKMIPVEILDSDQDGAFCSYYTNDSYQIELTTYSLYNLGIIPNKKISCKAKKRLKATLAHEYAHFYYNDCFLSQFAELIRMFFVIMLLLNFNFTYVFAPFLANSLYSKFIEYRADLFAWKAYPEELVVELTESKKEEEKLIFLIDRLRFFFFGTHPQYSNRIKFINYMKAKV